MLDKAWGCSSGTPAVERHRPRGPHCSSSLRTEVHCGAWPHGAVPAAVCVVLSLQKKVCEFARQAGRYHTALSFTLAAWGPPLVKMRNRAAQTRVRPFP